MNEENLEYAGYQPEEEIVDTAPEPEAAETTAKSKKSPGAAAAVEPEVVYVPPASSASTVAGVVYLSRLAFESDAQNSVSVAMVQERLIELGFSDAGNDLRGWLREPTRKALALYAGLSEEDVVVNDRNLIEKLFKGLDVVVSD